MEAVTQEDGHKAGLLACAEALLHSAAQGPVVESGGSGVRKGCTCPPGAEGTLSL